MSKTDQLQFSLFTREEVGDGKMRGMGRRWMGGRNKLFVQFEFLLMFERPVHFCITLKITYENNLLMQILTKMHLLVHCFQDSESFALKHLFCSV